MVSEGVCSIKFHEVFVSMTYSTDTEIIHIKIKISSVSSAQKEPVCSGLLNKFYRVARHIYATGTANLKCIVTQDSKLYR